MWKANDRHFRTMVESVVIMQTTLDCKRKGKMANLKKELQESIRYY
jgi:hypothetical protein